jgi:hypothetical protein
MQSCVDTVVYRRKKREGEIKREIQMKINEMLNQ